MVPEDRREDLWRTFRDTEAMIAFHGHAPTPDVYEVWFAYFSGRFPELRHRLDVLIEGGGQVDEAAILDLRDRFIDERREEAKVRETGERMAIELQRTLETIADAGRDTSNFADAMTRIAGRVGPQDDLAKVAETLIAATRHMESKARALEGELDRSAAEIETLRSGLEAVRQEALTDPLTGLLNRRGFDERLTTLLAGEIDRSPASMALILCDVDRFKLFNDRWGHQIGDAVLRLVGESLRAAAREGDAAARFGGDEFAVILPGASLDVGGSIAERVRNSVGRRELRDMASGQSIGRISMSFGVVQRRRGEPSESFIRRADQALYCAKEGGRNRVHLDGVASPV